MLKKSGQYHNFPSRPLFGILFFHAPCPSPYPPPLLGHSPDSETHHIRLSQTLSFILIDPVCSSLYLSPYTKSDVSTIPDIPHPGAESDWLTSRYPDQ